MIQRAAPATAPQSLEALRVRNAALEAQVHSLSQQLE
jgi:hypothetical protein